MQELPFSLERTVTICARRSTVFAYFTDSRRFAAWWGKGSTIEGRPGGRVHIVYPNGVEAGGEVVEIAAEHRVVFTYGFASGQPIPLGSSRVTITLDEDPGGTRVHLRHELTDEAARDQHVQGWRYQMAVFSNVVAAEAQAAAVSRVDDLFAAWSEPDAAARHALLEGSASPDLTFRDAHSATSGLDDLHPHLAAAQFHMPGLKLEREGDLRQCQGTAVAAWVARGADGTVKARGTNVYDFAPDGKIRRVVGLWG